MKKVIVIVIVIAIVVVAGFVGYQQFLAAATPTPTPAATEQAQAALPGVVSAEGFVVPVRKADLAFKAGGQVAEVLVAEGDRVEAKQVLARLACPQTDDQLGLEGTQCGERCRKITSYLVEGSGRRPVRIAEQTPIVDVAFQ